MGDVASLASVGLYVVSNCLVGGGGGRDPEVSKTLAWATCKFGGTVQSEAALTPQVADTCEMHANGLRQ